MGMGFCVAKVIRDLFVVKQNYVSHHSKLVLFCLLNLLKILQLNNKNIALHCKIIKSNFNSLKIYETRIFSYFSSRKPQQVKA
jgi:hypothetical protein